MVLQNWRTMKMQARVKGFIYNKYTAFVQNTIPPEKKHTDTHHLVCKL
jgi:hypothetical protein